MKTEFGIHTVERTGIDEARLGGRVFTGTIRLGTQFREACNIDASYSKGIPPRRHAADIALEVTKIECYGRDLDALDEGLTGFVTVLGTGFDQILPQMTVIENEA